ncbi:MAG: molybdate ABC transporter substrate-binding protein [Acidiferrobacter sp.]
MKRVSVAVAALSFAMLFIMPRADAHVTIRIFASDAVAQPVQQIGYLFEKAHPNVKLDYEFAASGVFMAPIKQGVPPDIFISSSNKEMNRLISLSFINFPQTIAYDYFAAATPCSNPVGHSRRPHVTASNLIQEIRAPNVKLAVASPMLSPAGRDTADMLAKMSANGAGPMVGILSHTQEVIGPNFILPQLISGKTDLGIVYASQVIGMKRAGMCVNDIPIAQRYNRKVKFSVAVLKASQLHVVGPVRKRLDAAYAGFLTSPKAQQIFKEWGFIPARNGGTFFSHLF